MSLPWYHTTTIYQIYPRSFYDSNGDGIGDLPGVIQKLDYLRDLGVETVWLSPFFASPQQDFGYDISDYLSVAPEYGTLDDALRLIEEAHRRGMRVLFDLVMNHTSDQHPWFKESGSSRHNPKADWYIWRDRPNNWRSLTGGSGWHYAPERDQYYWASFLPFQPDLNYRNPEVRQAMFDIARFWLRHGVDGFRLDIFNVIYKDAQFRNNPFTFQIIPSVDNPSGFFQEARYNLNQPESFLLARELRQVCDEFGPKLTLGEVSGRREVIRRYLGDTENDGLTLVFDFAMLNFRFRAEYFRRLIAEIEAAYPPPFMPVYVFSNHDRRRSMTRLRGDFRKARLLATLQLTVRGVPCLYNGEEIGMTDLPLPLDTALDPLGRKYRFLPRFLFDWMGMTINRDDVRTPMQWDSSPNAGFSSGPCTWLPVHPNYHTINVAAQQADPASLLNTIRTVLRLRRDHLPLREGSLRLLGDLPAQVLGYTRQTTDEPIAILLNFSEQPCSFPFPNGEILFHLRPGDDLKAGTARLEGLGGLIARLSS